MLKNNNIGLKKQILAYGISLAGFLGFLKYFEHHFFISYINAQWYLSIFALLFIGLGIWLGFQIVNLRRLPQNKPSNDIIIDEEKLKELQISKRELEVLELIARGHSNNEIANELFVSVNTVKTHSYNLFSKLDVKRRTQAVQKAKELNLI